MKLLALASLAATCVTAALIPSQVVRNVDLVRDVSTQDSQCTNGPTTRACWSNGFSIDNDYDYKWPNTGKTVYYNLVVSNGTCNPDGHGNRICLLVNNQYPGPVISANWGDNVQVTVTNAMLANGTAIHFHGLRQYKTPGADGVPGVSQCPIAPGQTYTYAFQATQYGSSWYHSHYSAQYGDGVLGPVVINGPASANYDVDLGPAFLTDWHYQTSWQVAAIAQQNLEGHPPTGPPEANNILINGANKDAQGCGHYSNFNVSSGKKFRLRLINGAVDNYFRFSIDNHTLQVIATDFVPIQPFYTTWIVLGAGQRYDVIINANQTAGNYWVRAMPAGDCGSINNGTGLAVLSYLGAPLADPTSSAFPVLESNCPEVHPTPYWPTTVPSSNFNDYADSLDVGFTTETVFPGSGSLVVWAINGSGIVSGWEDPTMSYIINKNTSYPAITNVLNSVAEGSWNYWVVQQTAQTPPIAHPIHLHGHDFFVLGTGSGNFNLATANLTWVNPTRRDTATLPGGGWLALAWEADNPGAWLMHCHIAWHISEGFGLQFVESPNTTVLPNLATYNATCDSWKKYYATAPYLQTDSGV